MFKSTRGKLALLITSLAAALSICGGSAALQDTATPEATPGPSPAASSVASPVGTPVG